VNTPAARLLMRVLRRAGRLVYESLVALGAAHVTVPPPDADTGGHGGLSAAEQRQWAAIVVRLRS